MRSKERGKRILAAALTVLLVFQGSGQYAHADDEDPQAAETQESSSDSDAETVENDASAETDIPGSEEADTEEDSSNETDEEQVVNDSSSSQEKDQPEDEASVMLAKQAVPEENPEVLSSPYDLDDNASGWIDQSNSYLHVEDQSGNKVPLSSGCTIPEYASFEMNIAIQVPSYENRGNFPGIQDGDVIRYKKPEWMRGLNASSGTVPNGSWEVKDGYIVLTFNSDFLNQNHYGATASLKLEGTMNNKTADGGQISVNTIHFLGNEYSNFQTVRRTNGIADMSLKKTAVSKTPIIDGGGELDAVRSAHYQVEVKAGDFDKPGIHNNTDLQNIVVNDAFKTYEKYDHDHSDYLEEDCFEQYISYNHINIKINGPEGEFTVCQDGKPVSSDGRSAEAVNGSNSARKSFKLNGVLRPDESLLIDYDAVIDEEMYENRPLGVFVSGENDPAKTKSGSASVNAEDNKGGNISWIARRADNTAEAVSVTDGVTKKETVTLDKKNQNDTDWFLTFDKTWLYKGADNTPEGGPQTGHISNWQISVNEGNRMPIDGYVLEDDFTGHKDMNNVTKDSHLVSDIRITDEDNQENVVDRISLDDIQNGSASGNWAGTTTEKLKYTFPAGSHHHYRIHFTTKGDENTTGDLEAFNSAVLREPVDRGSVQDDYGAACHWTTKGATVTKRPLSTDVDHGLIQWKTTIDAGIEIKNGSHYDDYVYWKRTDRSYHDDVEEDSRKNDAGNFTDTSKESTGANAEDKKLHQITPETLNLKITAGSGDHITELTEGTDYTLSYFSDEEVNAVKGDYWNHGLTSGYRITFLKTISNGPVIISYSTKAGFNQVNFQAEFFNIAKYRTDPDGGSIVAENSVSYAADGSLKKSVSRIDGNNIVWNLRVNETRHPTQAGYIVEDTIPDGLNFDLNGLSPQQFIYDTNENSGIWDNNALINSFDKSKIQDDGTKQSYSGKYFDASYDRSSRLLRLVIHPKAANRAFTNFDYTTSVTAEKLAEAEKSSRKIKFDNTAKLYSNGTGKPEIQESGAWAWIQVDVLSKTETYTSKTAPYVNYEITVNKNSAELAPVNHQVYIQDSGMQSPLIFQRNSLVIKDKYGNRYSEGEKADPAARTYQYKETAGGGFLITIPDRTQLVISYQAYAPGVSGDTLNTTNKVELYADGKPFTSFSAGKASEAWIAPHVNVNGTDRIAIRKTDADHPEQGVKGAVFAIYEAEGNDYSSEGRKIGEIKTDQNGIACSYKEENGYARLSLNPGRVYLVKEVQAPGYSSGNQYPYYLKNNDYLRKFYITKENAKSSDPEIQDLRNNHPDVVLINHGCFDYQDECQDSEIPYTSVTAVKKWNDAENQDGKRTSVTLHLHATVKVDGTEKDLSDYIDPSATSDKVITEDEARKRNEQKVTWNNLPKTDSDGHQITYTVSETKIGGQNAEDQRIYESAVTGDQYSGYTIINTHVPETVSVTGTKIWKDADNQDDMRKDVTLHLKKTAGGKTTEVSKKTIPADAADDALKVEWKDLPAYEDGQKIIYSITEDSMDGYDAQVTERNENDFIVTNTHVPETVDVSGQKTWLDDGPEGRPASIMVHLTRKKADGTYEDAADVDPVEINAENQWQYTFRSVPKNEKGREIVYGVREDVPQGYSAKINGTDLVNTKLIRIPVHNSWEDDDNRYGHRPASVKIRLIRNGEPMNREETLSDGNEWKSSFDNLPLYDENGQRITYTVQKDQTDSYEKPVITGSQENGFDINNVCHEKGEPESSHDGAVSAPKTSSSPDTSDHTHLPLAAGMLGCSLMLAVWAVVLKKKMS